MAQIKTLEQYIDYLYHRCGYPVINVVLDLFGGSGSTLIACEKTGRKARLMEIDEIYCQVIIDRWQEYTKQEAVKA